MGPGDLARALCGLERIEDPNLLVGFDHADDAGVYRLTDEIALIQTLDFFTPIVDDPFIFGQIAAANSLSDVYAMGGRPLCAMNIVCFPVKEMAPEVLREVLRGGLDKLREARVTLAGGHSVEDRELKYGLSVTGLVHPQRILTNQGARPGDRLVLTKPLGTGIVSTAVKAEMASAEAQAASIATMTTLNRQAAERMSDLPVHACTDVTGFGLLGHACEMAEGTPIEILLRAAALPLLSGVEAYAEQGLLPGGLHRNREFRESMVTFDPDVPQALQDIAFDPQTSGGLLVALPAEAAETLRGRLVAVGLPAVLVGEVREGTGRVRLRAR